MKDRSNLKCLSSLKSRINELKEQSSYFVMILVKRTKSFLSRVSLKYQILRLSKNVITKKTRPI